MITGCDKAFGSLIDKLKEVGVYDNTIIVFTSDHGDMLRSNNRFGPKSYPELESVGVPFILKLPGSQRAATTTDLLLGSMDIVPTMLSLLGCEPPNTVQGKDLSSDILAGREDTVESVPLMYFAPAWRGVYTKRYTYARGKVYLPDIPAARGYSDSANVLYDRARDPYEQENKFSNPAYKDIKDQMEVLMQQWLEKFDDKFWDGKYVLKKLMNAEQIGFFRAGDTGIMTKPNTMPIDILKQSYDSKA